MFKIYAKTRGRGGTTSVSSYSPERVINVSDIMVVEEDYDNNSDG